MINLSVFRWGYYSALSGWAQCNHKSLYKKEPGGSGRDGDECREVVVMQDHEPTECRHPPESGKGKETLRAYSSASRFNKNHLNRIIMS